MSKLIGLALGASLLLPFANSAREAFTKYKAIEAYEVRPGVMLMPRYSADGQVCEIGLEKLHYSPEKIRLDDLSVREVNQIFDELIPAEERVPQGKGFENTLITQTGSGLLTQTNYKNVSLEIYSEQLSAGRHTMTVSNVIGVIRWKNRQCQ